MVIILNHFSCKLKVSFLMHTLLRTNPLALLLRLLLLPPLYLHHHLVPPSPLHNGLPRLPPRGSLLNEHAVRVRPLLGHRHRFSCLINLHPLLALSLRTIRLPVRLLLLGRSLNIRVGANPFIGTPSHLRPILFLPL